MRALGLFATQLIPGAAPTTADRSSRPSDPLPPLDDETLLAWRAWAREAPDAGSQVTDAAPRDGATLTARPSAGHG